MHILVTQIAEDVGVKLDELSFELYEFDRHFDSFNEKLSKSEDNRICDPEQPYLDLRCMRKNLDSIQRVRILLVRAASVLA